MDGLCAGKEFCGMRKGRNTLNDIAEEKKLYFHSVRKRIRLKINVDYYKLSDYKRQTHQILAGLSFMV